MESTHQTFTEACRRNFTPLADIGESIISRHKNDLIGDEVERWALELTSQCCTVCLCRIPAPFFDIDSRRDTESDKVFRLEKVALTRSHDGPIGSISLETVAQNTCTTDTSDSHNSCLYLQLGRWEPGMHHQLPVIVALILEVVQTKPDIVYRSVGRALVPTDSVHDTQWPIETVTII
jgi:hypothetical protein